jgi:hypothetical protein
MITRHGVFLVLSLFASGIKGEVIEEIVRYIKRMDR